MGISEYMRYAMKRVFGRPADEAGRTANEIATYDFLDGLGISYERIDHPAARTMEDCREADLALEAAICKNLVLCNRQQTQFYLMLIPGEKRFRTSDVSHILGVSRLSFASPEKLKELLDVTPGSVSVLCLQKDTENRVQLLVDRELCSDTYIGCHPCINTSSLRLKQADLWGTILPALHHEPVYIDLPDRSVEGEAL